MKVTVCIGSSCHLKGSRNIVEGLQGLIAENKLEDKVELGFLHRGEVVRCVAAPDEGSFDAWIENEAGERVEATPHPMMHYTIPCEKQLMPYTLLRMQKKEA